MLGKLLDKDDSNRDAIHVAIIPVTAHCELRPGQRIGLNAEGLACDKYVDDALGVVDPFLPVSTVMAGDRFYLLLFPGTITSLRHHWVHPAFDGPSKEYSKSWIDSYAATGGMTGDHLIDAARRYAEWDDYTFDNSEDYKAMDYRKLPEFWEHFTNVTGIKTTDKETMPFTCSC